MHAPSSTESQSVRNRFAQKLRDFDACCEEYRSLDSTHGGRLVDVDEVRRLCPEYEASKQGRRMFSEATHEPASVFAKRYLDWLLDEARKRNEGGIVWLIGGGPGSGKSSASQEALSNDGICVVDKAFSSSTTTRALLERLVSEGWAVRFVFVYRPAHLAMQGVLKRALEKGRVVPAHVVADAHFGAMGTLSDLLTTPVEGVEVFCYDNSGPLSEADWCESCDKLIRGRYESREAARQAVMNGLETGRVTLKQEYPDLDQEIEAVYSVVCL